MKPLTKEQILLIHFSLHNNSTAIDINGRNLAITKAPNGCKRVFVNDFEFITQNPNTFSKYAKWAKEGHKISWGRKSHIFSEPWIFCKDNEIIIPETNAK